MKSFLVLALIAASSSSLANAQNNFYASLKSGVIDTKFKNSQYEYIESDELYLADNQNKSMHSAIALAVGYDFSKTYPLNVRLELEYMDKGETTYNPDFNTLIDFSGVYQYGISSSFINELNVESLMLNGYYDFKNTSKVTPYVSAGVGLTRIENKIQNIEVNSTDTASDDQITWSAGMGLTYAVSENFALDLSYRYVDSGNFNFKTKFHGIAVHSEAKLVSNEYLLGARYSF